jgi:hypothetical protein
MDDFTNLARLLDALRPWASHIVIVGGWAHRLHRFHPLAHPPAYAPLVTRDADVAFSAAAPLEGDINAALKAAGFTKTLSGEFTPPVTQYTLDADAGGFYAEFLVPLVGSDLKRNGTPDATIATAGITAQKLRHLDLLLASTWSVRVSSNIGVPVSQPLDVRVPNPVSFIIQKLLIHKHRRPNKQAQDALYIHDTLDLFGRELSTLNGLWLKSVRPFLPPGTAKTVERLRVDQFGEVTDVIRNAARIPQDRALAPGTLQAACAYGLGEILVRRDDADD